MRERERERERENDDSPVQDSPPRQFGKTPGNKLNERLNFLRSCIRAFRLTEPETFPGQRLFLGGGEGEGGGLANWSHVSWIFARNVEN